MNISARAHKCWSKKSTYAGQQKRAALQFKWNVLFCLKCTNTQAFSPIDTRTTEKKHLAQCNEAVRKKIKKKKNEKGRMTGERTRERDSRIERVKEHGNEKNPAATDIATYSRKRMMNHN